MSEAAVKEEFIKCMICGADVHVINGHLEKNHKGVSLEDYQKKFPGAPILSPFAQSKMAAIEAAKKKKAEQDAAVIADSRAVVAARVGAFHEVFGLGKNPTAMNKAGGPIPCNVLGDTEHKDMVPAIDPNYVFNVDVLKTLMAGIELNIPIYLWGHAGTGKTTMFKQLCARTNRAMVRVQHTANMEEEHIVGGWRLRDGHTVFELGPLPLAMKHGWFYIADEYDFGRPEVLSVYQAVLEGEPLFIKEADAANRVVKPHPNFRIGATANTNGQGDESGLYQGTNLQNAAAVERFGIVECMPYMDRALEVKLVAAQADIAEHNAKKLVEFATEIRALFDANQIGNPISPRSLIYAAKMGIAKDNYRVGLQKAYINRLSAVHRQVADQYAQRIFS